MLKFSPIIGMSVLYPTSLIIISFHVIIAKSVARPNSVLTTHIRRGFAIVNVEQNQHLQRPAWQFSWATRHHTTIDQDHLLMLAIIRTLLTLIRNRIRLKIGPTMGMCVLYLTERHSVSHHNQSLQVGPTRRWAHARYPIVNTEQV